MNEYRSQFGCDTLDGYLYAVGGWGGSNGGLSDTIERISIIDIHNIGSVSWEIVSTLSTNRQGYFSLALNGDIYTLGGGLPWSDTARVERYHPVTDTNDIDTSLPAAIGNPCAVRINDRVYVVGSTDIYYNEQRYGRELMVGGTATTYSDFPFMVVLLNGDEDVPYCSG